MDKIDAPVPSFNSLAKAVLKMESLWLEGFFVIHFQSQEFVAEIALVAR